MLMVIILIIGFFILLYVARDFFYDEIEENAMEQDSDENEVGYRDYNPFIFKDIVK